MSNWRLHFRSLFLGLSQQKRCFDILKVFAAFHARYGYGQRHGADDDSYSHDEIMGSALVNYQELRNLVRVSQCYET